VSVPQTIARWVQRDQCGGNPQRVLQVPGADRVRPGKEAASTALDASATIWRFFASQPAR